MKGVSAHSIVLGNLHNSGGLDVPAHQQDELLTEVHALLARLGREGRLLRSHVVVAGLLDDSRGLCA
jgi:hypothetical protein